MRILVKTRIYPTESEEKIRIALEKLFPGVEFSRSGDEIVGESTDPRVLDRFREVIRSRKVRDSIESLLLENWHAGRTFLALNKQDATKGVFNIAESSPLGDILLEIEIPREDIHELVWGDSGGSGSEVQGR